MKPMKKFVVYIPVEITANREVLKELWDDLRYSGASLSSTDGSRYNIRTDKLKFKDVVSAWKKTR